jgi:hypothetical protein
MSLIYIIWSYISGVIVGVLFRWGAVSRIASVHTVDDISQTTVK